jgi:uncharacterized protein with PIN domain
MPTRSLVTTSRALSADGHRYVGSSGHSAWRTRSGSLLAVDHEGPEPSDERPLRTGGRHRDPCPEGTRRLREFDLLVHSAGATIVSFDADQVLLARSAYEMYGKGHHPAALNFGDCCSYALSRSSGEPLLFKGNDFSQTGVMVVELAHPGS